jgi:(hydroxyamino)benzene mutase
MKTQKRRLMFHGMLLFLLGLITGLLEQHFTNVRMGLSAHLEGVINGILLLALGAGWNEVRLPHPIKLTAYCTALYGTYANWLVTSIAAVFGTAANSPVTSPATAVSHGKRALSQWDFSLWRSQSSLRRYSFSGVFEEPPPSSTIVGSIRNLTFPERRKDADHEPGERAAFDAHSSGGTPLLRRLMPVCYIGQSRNAVLVQHGFHLVELTFRRFTPKFHAAGFRRN